MKKYGFALIGCGAIAGIHSQAIKEMSQAELVGVYDTFSESAERFAKEKNCKAFESMEALLSDSGVDIVCICTPSGLHAELAMRVAKAKKHIVVEKPMAITKESLAELIEVIRENQVKCAVIAQLRFTSAVQKIKKAIADEKLGTIRTVDFTMRYLRTQEYYDKGAWRGTWAMDGGGALMNQGIHGIDLVQYLVGGVASVYAQCRTLARNIEVEDTANLLVEYKCGAIGVIRCTTLAKPGYPRRIEITGDNGTIVLKEDVIERWDIDGETCECDGITCSNSGCNSMAIPYEYHKLQFNDLIDAIENNRKPLVDELEGRKPVDVILSAYESEKTGKKVLL